MKFLLVLQLPENLLDYDDMIDLEDLLVKKLKSKKEEVDGHDIGSGELNFFIYTKNPNDTFQRIMNILDDNIKENLKVAYRDVEGEEYTVLFPESLDKFSIK